MATPTFTLPTSGSDPRRATKESLEENINQIIQYLDNARISGDAALMAGLEFQGGWDASTNTFPDQDKDGGFITKGDFFWVSTASTFGGVTYSVNEPLVALVDSPSTVSASDWYHTPINSSLVPIIARVDTLESGVFWNGVFEDSTSLSEIDGTLTSSWSAYGATGFVNKLGVNNVHPVTGTWLEDTGYTTGQASYSAIISGYDNIANGIASVIASQHSMATSDSDHGTIIGGSVNGILKGGYCGIFAGTDNRIMDTRLDMVTVSPASHGIIIGGLQNRVYNANAGIFAAQLAEVDGQYANVIGGISNKALGNFDHVAGSNNESRKGTAGTGQKNTIGGGRLNFIDSTNSPISNTISGGEDIEIFGSYNSVGGGIGNEVGDGSSNASHSVVAGGWDNIIGNVVAASIGGGRSNAASASYATVSGGQGNSATANHSVVVGGQNNVASALNSIAMGNGAVARNASGLSIADGSFSAVGDAQASLVMRKTTTTNDAVTYMQTIALPDNTTVAFSALIVGRCTNDSGLGAGYRVEGVIERNVGTASTSLIGSVTTTTIGEDTASWDTSAIANASSGGLSISVRGATGKTVLWVAKVDLAEVSG